MKKKRRYSKKPNRDWDPEYILFRKRVLARDKYKCQFPLCNRTVDLEVHHILTYGKNPRLRKATYNGITLCKTHHLQVTGKEEQYEPLFFKIISIKSKLKFKDKYYFYNGKKKKKYGKNKKACKRRGFKK